MNSSISLLLLVVALSIHGFHITKRQTDPSRNCTCVPYYQCYPNFTMNTGGEGLITYKKREATYPTFDGKGKINEAGFAKLDLKLMAGISTDRTQKFCTVSTDVCCKVVGNAEKEFTDSRCGYSKSRGVPSGSRIAVQQQTEFADFPWMVAVFHEQEINSVPTKVYIGGGSLIHPRVVLTAAHIVRGISGHKLYIRAGEWDLFSDTEPLPHQDRKVSNLVMHRDFAQTVGFNDFALLILDTPVDIQPHIDTICLPEPEDRFDHSMCITTGWGMNKTGGHYHAIMKSLQLPVIPNRTCQSKLRKTTLGPYFKLDQSLMCAGGGEEQVDTCLGDGGSPLICRLELDSTRYVQVGIVSWGMDCATPGNPGVYASVAKARAWIDKTFKKFKMDEIYVA